jgi:hypothetical protein
MEADIFIWQKPGHSYFALTRTGPNMSNQNRNVPFLTKLEMAPFCVLRLLSPCFFCFRGFFLKKFRVQRL